MLAMEIVMEEESGAVAGGVRHLLRLEGLGVVVAATLFFGQLGGDWKLFALLF